MGILAAVFVLLLTAVSSYAQSPSQEKGPPPVPVEVSPVVEKEVLSIVDLVGTAEAWLETVLASEEPGLVREMLVDEGDKVRRGQVLCRLDAAQLRLTLKAQEAALAEAEVQVARARREWERQKRLFEINSVSEKAYEDARFDLEGNEKRVINLKSQLPSYQRSGFLPVIIVEFWHPETTNLEYVSEPLGSDEPGPSSRVLKYSVSGNSATVHEVYNIINSQIMFGYDLL